jgi:tetratricopeptide (TPR) repeat protein
MTAADNQEAVLQQAMLDVAAGQLDAAEAKCMAVLTNDSRHPTALLVLGQVLHAKGRLDEAARVFNALTLMEPAVQEHWQNLGAVLRLTGQYDQALKAFERALRLGKPSSALLYNLGMLQIKRLDYDAAYLALRDASRLNPADATVRWGYAQCCFDLLNRDEALSALQGWQHLQGLTLELTVRIIQLLVSLGVQDQAHAAIERVLCDSHLSGRAAIAIAGVLERLYRLDEAQAIMAKLALDHSFDADPEQLCVSAILAERAGRYDEARHLLASSLQGNRDFVHQYHARFLVARVENAAGRYDDAYHAALEAHRSQVAYIEQALGKSAGDDSMTLVRAGMPCDPEDVAQWRLQPGPSTADSPVFIVGFPRSGTTLLELALDAHPMLQSMDEQPFLPRATNDLTDLGIPYPAALGRLTPAMLDDLRARYWERVRKRAPLLPGRRLVDKNPLNMVLLPLIRRLFPNAHIILTVRHPCDVLLSCFLQHFNSPGLALMCRDLPTLAAAYSRVFSFWYSQWPLLRPASFELQYERLTAGFESEMRALVDFLQLRWDPAVLQPDQHARDKGYISTPSYAQVVRPVSTRSIGRWQQYRRYFEPILPELMPWLERWQYATD